MNSSIAIEIPRKDKLKRKGKGREPTTYSPWERIKFYKHFTLLMMLILSWQMTKTYFPERHLNIKY